MIERNIEIIIEDTIKHYPITLVTGPRQIGKSTLLYNSFLNKGYNYISLDDSLEILRNSWNFKSQEFFIYATIYE